MARSKMTPKPGRIDLPAHDVEACRATDARPRLRCARGPLSPVRTTQAAAPSPNSAVATMLALVSWSMRKAAVQISIATRSTVEPGRARARRSAIARPETPPAQPSPNTGTRSTSDAEAHAAGNPRLEAGRGDAGRGDGDDGVDVARLAAGVGQRAARRVDEQSPARPRGRRRCAPASRDRRNTSRAASPCSACGCRRSRTPAPCARRRRSGGRRCGAPPPRHRTAAGDAAARHGRGRAAPRIGPVRSTSASFEWRDCPILGRNGACYQP